MLGSYYKNFIKDINKKGHNIPEEAILNILKSPNRLDHGMGCNLMHGNMANKSCLYAGVANATVWGNKTLQTYALAHIIPLVLYKRKEIKQNPVQVLKKQLKNIVCSNMFNLSMCLMQRITFCGFQQKGTKTSTTQLTSFLLASGIFFESGGRIEEIAIWNLSRFFELVWNYLNKRKQIEKKVPGFLLITFAISIGIFCEVYIKSKNTLKSKYKYLGLCLLDRGPDNYSTEETVLKMEPDESAMVEDEVIKQEPSQSRALCGGLTNELLRP